MKELSAYNAELKMVFPIFISLFGSLIMGFVLVEYSILSYLISPIILILGISWAYKKYRSTYNLFYDNNNLVLKNKKSKRDISLTDIKKVKLRMSDMRILGIQFYTYTIRFKNEANTTETISIFISTFNSNFKNFQDLLKLESPNTIIEDFARNWERNS